MILAKKIGMTQLFDDKANLIAVTVVEAGPCLITQVKTLEKEGYNAIQVGFINQKEKRLTKPIRLKFKKANLEAKRYLKEFRLTQEDINNYKLGDEIKANIFEIGEAIDITANSKGKGFQGAIKRHNFHRGPMAHGSKYHRKAGSMSSATTPGRVKKGKKMAGHMGNQKTTIQNLKIFNIDLDKNLLLIQGSVPGPNGCLLALKNSVKIKKASIK
jgi:large subunit ribosomal protein L3